MEFEDEDPSFSVKSEEKKPSPHQAELFEGMLSIKEKKKKVRFKEKRENEEADHEKNSLSTNKTSPGGKAVDITHTRITPEQETYGFSVEPSPSPHLAPKPSGGKEVNYMRSKFRYFNRLNIGRPPASPYPVNSAPQSNPIPIQLENNLNSDFDSDWKNTIAAHTFIPPHELVNRSAFSVWDKQRRKIPKNKDF